MASTFAYELTVTPTGSLLVNGTETTPPNMGTPWSTDDVLEWALSEIAVQHEEVGGTLTLTIDDKRSGGYGRHRTTLSPGQVATIDALRQMTQKDLSGWTPESAAAPASPTAPPKAPDDPPSTEDTSESESPTPQESPARAAETPAEAPVEEEPRPARAHEPAVQEDDDQQPQDDGPEAEGRRALTRAEIRRREREAQGGEPAAPVETPVEATPPAQQPYTAEPPPQPVQEPVQQQPEAPPAAPVQQPAQPSYAEEPPYAEDTAPRAGDVGFSFEAAAAEDAGGTAEPEPKKKSLLSFGKKFGKGEPKKKEPREKKAKPKKEPRGKAKKSAAPEPEVEETPTGPPEGWIEHVPKPGTERPVIEEEVKEDKPKVKTVGLWKVVLTAIIAVAVTAGAFMIYLDNKDQITYVAVCVDSRTEARVTPDEVCDSDENTGYYRWWYVAEGGEVPAVGGRISRSQGSFSAPGDEAPVTFGFEDEGGVHNPPDPEGEETEG